MKRKISPNFLHLLHAFKLGYSGAILEGSARSTKTWGSIDFIIWLCTKRETNATIKIIKETYNSFKTTLYEDFNRRLPMYGIRSPFQNRQEISQFYIFGNTIHLLGADNESKFHGSSCDYFFVNEWLDVPQAVVDQAEMRCRKFWWGDYNPKTTDHYVYDKFCTRKDMAFKKTTFLDNPYISAAERRKILSYQPTQANIDQGTADDYMWAVYGLGLRSAPEGLIFQHVTWLQEFPTGIERIYYGSDIGKTNSPSTVVKVGVNGDNLYLQKLAYEPTPSPNEYIPLVRAAVPTQGLCWADSAEPGYIADCRRAGLMVLGVRKFPGAITYGISLLKKYKIHIIDCPEWRKEQANYKYREIHGIKLDEPVDEFNHLWDAARYAVMSNCR